MLKLLLLLLRRGKPLALLTLGRRDTGVLCMHVFGQKAAARDVCICVHPKRGGKCTKGMSKHRAAAYTWAVGT